MRGLLVSPSSTAAAEQLHRLVAEPVHLFTRPAVAQHSAIWRSAPRRLADYPVIYRRDHHGVITRWHVSAEEDEAWAERRQAFERAAVSLTGLDREARLEGTALILSGREHTDRPFPTDANIKQLALLLIPELCAAALGDEPVRRSLPAGSPQIDRDIALDAAARLIAEHHGFWKAWEPDDPVSVAVKTARALGHPRRRRLGRCPRRPDPCAARRSPLRGRHRRRPAAVDGDHRRMNHGRFAPTRAGIIGLYQYADQVFCFEEGRLALRGRNTSGKSKVLELVVPFVLDGDISPRKLDPFAKDSRDMHWNLIGATDKFPDARSDQRFGYVWLEFHHPLDDTWLTAIIGLKANRANPREVTRAYWVTHQRVGIDLVLCEHAADRATPVGLDTAAEHVEAAGGSWAGEENQ